MGISEIIINGLKLLTSFLKVWSKINAWQGSDFASVTGKLLKCLFVSISMQSLFYVVYVVCFLMKDNVC